MNPRDEDDAWRAIVENFGERAVLDEELPSAELDLNALEEQSNSAGRDVPGAPEDSAGAPEDFFGTRDDLSGRRDDPSGNRDDPGPRPDSPGPFVPGPEHEREPIEQQRPSDPFAMHDDEGRFVPPTPPMPYVPPKRLLAWSSLALVPLFLIIAALTGNPVSGFFSTLLVAAWVGAFGYLVWTMPDEPRDPFDDGSRV